MNYHRDILLTNLDEFEDDLAGSEDPSEKDEDSTDIPDEPNDSDNESEELPKEPDSEEIALLKFRLREEDYPLYTNDELQNFIDLNKGDLNMATYEAAIMKAQASGLSLNGIEFKTLSDYFLRIAAMYKPHNSGVLKS